MAEVQENTAKQPREAWVSTVIVDAEDNFIGYLNVPAASLADPKDVSKLNEFIGSKSVTVKLPEAQERPTRF